MSPVFDPISLQLIHSLIHLVNRSTGIVDDARLSISSQLAGSYVFASPSARRSCHESLGPLQNAGVIECAWHLQVLDDFETLKHIHIPNGKSFLDFLGVASQASVVANTATELNALKCDTGWINQKITEIGERWHLGARYLQLGPEHIDQVKIAATVAQKLASEPLCGRSMKALSLDWFGASHIIEDHRHIIALFCESQINRFARDLGHMDQMASLGLVNHSPLLHMRGPFDAICDDETLLDISGWSGVALCSEFVRGFERSAVPSYVLTIENLTLYQRYIAAVRDEGLVIYVGDFPTAVMLAHYQKIVQSLPVHTPLYHWGNIDLPGYKSVLALNHVAHSNEVMPFNMGSKQLLDGASRAVKSVPLPLNKLKKLAFSSPKFLRSVLVDIASLPADHISEVQSEGMAISSPQHVREVYQQPLPA